MVFSFSEKSYKLKTCIYQLVSKLYRDREAGGEGWGPGRAFLSSKSTCVGFHTVR